MQNRHTDRFRYFSELAATTQEYFMPYIKKFHDINADTEILEIGCGEGGNLLPFAVAGCKVTGIDISANRIRQAKEFFSSKKCVAEFINDNIFDYSPSKQFDIILCHDVFEHISTKAELLDFCYSYLKPEGVVFLAFPPWRMPFGGHQQICRNCFLSHSPFIHLLPKLIYRKLLNLGKETNKCIKELMDIRSTSVSINQFHKLINQSKLGISDQELWLINPHYRQKFGIKPQKLNSAISRIPYFRDFVTSAFICILQPKP